ncbi:phosphoribosylformylglycinamidine synthase subunit PurS [Alicyclobacillus mali]|uniref:Phosphoribosylformylglycinamidine synthase subunit PurS n=1 Tax=Alicyclobacillus mali (ex Roth et al. 2021) TaxID=1123961 RepID=A0ABS0F478_9BACL|nr:phosphoribosylformylglycinamidine synthase subunit PurS [Alicyclobacillus mali (ex Roth et al. 2021)]MBF8378105.1 phosphoribosylformylglycinamidine synthase subunit PurS [Alicyclobacillus mali (ex Roth et al. 2021)]
MKQFEVEVKVWLKPSVFDPQGHAVHGALVSLGFDGAGEVRIGKFIQMTLEAEDEQAAARQVDDMCQKVLANPVMETYAFEIRERGQ